MVYLVIYNVMIVCNSCMLCVPEVSFILCINCGNKLTMTTPAKKTGNGKQKETATQRKRRWEKAKMKYKEKRDSECQEDKKTRLQKRRRQLEDKSLQQRSQR